MFDELNGSFARVRIAALQSTILSRASESDRHVVRHQRNKVTVVAGPKGIHRLEKKRLVQARRE